MQKGFILIDQQKNVLLVRLKEDADFLDDLHITENIKRIRRHKTKRELDETIREYLKEGGLEDAEPHEV